MLSVPDLNDKGYGSGYTGVGYGQKVPWYKKKAVLWTAASILVIAAIAGGVAGYFLSRDSSSGKTSSGRTITSVSKDSNLHLSFPGMCYSPPYSSFYPNCGDTIEGVQQDVELMAQLTTTLRLYGADCNTSALVLDAINRSGVNMTVFLGIYMDSDSTVFDRQVTAVTDAIQQFGTDNIQGIISGNEYVLNQFTANGTRGQAAAQDLVISNMAVVRTKLQALDLKKTIPVGFADAGSMITTALAQGSDFVMANVHPFFSGVGINLAAGWTYEYLETDTPASAKLATNKPPIYEAEVGWPGGAFANGSLTLNGSDASLANMQSFLDSYVCQANTNSTPYFWFEAFDEEWKASQYGGAESFWGLFNSDRTLKDITIPNCEPATFD